MTNKFLLKTVPISIIKATMKKRPKSFRILLKQYEIKTTNHRQLLSKTKLNPLITQADNLFDEN